MMGKKIVDIFKMREGVTTPNYETEGSAGVDLRASLPFKDEHVWPGGILVVPTGLKVSIPQGYEFQIRPRSGLAAKGIGVANSPGTIDSDYRGEVKVLLTNNSEDIFNVSDGDRIAQMVLAPVVQAEFNVVDRLDATKRGEGGLGSTGIE
jgi:dUTP pyrophosphatase